jgi:uncharacterized membrane protein YfcA
MSSVSSDLTGAAVPAPAARLSLWTELLREQGPIIAATLALGVVASYLQHGVLVGGDRPFPLAGVRVAPWHLAWLGFSGGFLMALVGQGTGIYSLPYAMSILKFDNAHVSPTNLLITVINPVGALLGFRRTGQWNLDFALWPCLGSLVGALIGPFPRVLYLTDPVPFKAMVGVALLWLGAHLVWEISPWAASARGGGRGVTGRVREHPRAVGRSPARVRIETLERSWRRIRIGFLGETWSLSVPGLFFLGAAVGLVASTLGAGGAFLLVPLLVTLYRMPMYVIVATTIPFVIVQSAVGLFSYVVVVPALTGHSTAPEWAFGFFVAAPAVLGAWLAAKTQRFVPDWYLKLATGALTGAGGLLYLLNYFVPLPFRI